MPADRHTAVMRVLLADAPVTFGPVPAGPLDLDALAQAYAVPSPSATWLRVNMVSTLDGAATGADGLTGSINTSADHVVFELLRAISDVLVIGAGTARAEGYRPVQVTGRYAVLRAATGRAAPLALAIVTRSGALPPKVLHRDPATPVLAVTCADSPELADLRHALGSDQVIVAGEHGVDLAETLRQLHARGLRHVHSEGGPHLLGKLLSADLVDELDITYSPVAVGGLHRRIAVADELDRAFRPRLLVEEEGTVMGRWLRDRPVANTG